MTGHSYVIRSEINQRDDNEDSFHLFEISPVLGQLPLTVLTVADGMGGHAHGEYFSREALRKFSLVIFEELTSQNINCIDISNTITNREFLSKALVNSLEQTNFHIKRMAETNKWGKAGSTIVFAAIQGATVIAGNLGDSPIYHYQSKINKLAKITEDHTVAGALERGGLISSEMARHHEGRSQLEFFLGCSKFPKDSPIQVFTLDSNDLLLLCTDGISGSFSDMEISQIISENSNSLMDIADQLIKLSHEAGETDNQTLILWQFNCQKVEEVKVEISSSNLNTSQIDSFQRQDVEKINILNSDLSSSLSTPSQSNDNTEDSIQHNVDDELQAQKVETPDLPPFV